MSIRLRFAAWILLIVPVAMTPRTSAAGFDTVRAEDVRAVTGCVADVDAGRAGDVRSVTASAAGSDAIRFDRLRASIGCGVSNRQNLAAQIVQTVRIDCVEAHASPARASELRVFALYGLREFSTFSPGRAGARVVGETTLGGKPLDRHADDPWLGFDKAQHLSFSFLWTLGTQYVAVNKGHLSESQALPISIGTSALIGLSKEYYDLVSGPPNVFSYRDLVANGVGILLATGLILL